MVLIGHLVLLCGLPLLRWWPDVHFAYSAWTDGVGLDLPGAPGLSPERRSRILALPEVRIALEQQQRETALPMAQASPSLAVTKIASVPQPTVLKFFSKTLSRFLADEANKKKQGLSLLMPIFDLPGF